MTTGTMFWKPPRLLLSAWLLFLLNGSMASAAAAADISTCKLPAVDSVYLSAGFGYELDCVPSTGTLRAFMLFVDFPDAAATEASPRELYDFFLPAAAAWYATASGGALTLDVAADTSRFVRMPAASSSYGYKRGLTAKTHYAYIQDAIDGYYLLSNSSSAAAAAPPPEIPADTEVLYVVATRNAAEISFSPTYMNAAYSRLNGTAAQRRRAARKTVTVGLDAYRNWGPKVLNHETGHTMCLPDYYPGSGGRPAGYYIGGWDLMGHISGPAPDYFAWDKWRLGWLPDAAVECVSMFNASSTDISGTSTHTLHPLGASGGKGVRAVVVARNTTDALVAEMRTKTGVDSNMCAAPGVLLYTVSTTVATGNGPVRVLDANPGSGGCAGDELNDATLSLRGGGASSYAVPGWGVNVTVTAQTDDSATIRIDIS